MSYENAVVGHEYRYSLYAVLDRVANEFGAVFQAVNDGVAFRNYRRLLEQEGIRGDEYAIFKIGAYDVKKGYISALDTPIELSGQEDK